MRIKALAAAVMAISLSTAGMAVAQGYGNDRGRNDSNYDRGRNDSNYNRSRNDNNYRRGGYDARDSDRGEWRRGGRLPAEYRNRHYVVNDWRGHHLSAPPRGYHWVQHGNDYVLAAITTGVIANILLNHR